MNKFALFAAAAVALIILPAVSPADSWHNVYDWQESVSGWMDPEGSIFTEPKLSTSEGVDGQVQINHAEIGLDVFNTINAARVWLLSRKDRERLQYQRWAFHGAGTDVSLEEGYAFAASFVRDGTIYTTSKEMVEAHPEAYEYINPLAYQFDQHPIRSWGTVVVGLIIAGEVTDWRFGLPERSSSGGDGGGGSVPKDAGYYVIRKDGTKEYVSEAVYLAAIDAGANIAQTADGFEISYPEEEPPPEGEEDDPIL